MGSATSGPKTPRRRARQAKLAATRISLWSVVKLSLLLSVCLALAGVAFTAGLWLTLSGTGAFATVQTAINDTIGSSPAKVDLMGFLSLSRVVSVSIVIGVINVVLITVGAVVAAVLYNVCSALVGGVQLTLLEDR